MEWEKKQIIERKQKALARPARPINIDLHRMSMQVKEVLPHVPMNAIYNDLCKYFLFCFVLLFMNNFSY